MQFTRRAVLLAGAVLPFIDAARAFGTDTTLIDAVRSRVLDVMQAGGVPGAAAALVVDGEPVWVESFGSTKDHGTQPIGVHTIFSLQSCSKSFTATAVMIAVQRGLVNLDAAITTYIPEFKVNSRLETEPQKKITVRMLLNHTAGFTHEAPIGNNFVDGDWTFATHLRSIQEMGRYPIRSRPNGGCTPRVPMALPSRPNERWSAGFVHDQLADGRRIRILDIVDDCSRVCVGQYVHLSISSARMARLLDELQETRGLPKTLVLDNGRARFELRARPVNWRDQTR